MEQAIVIFSGYNMRAVIAFLRVSKKYNISIIIVAAGEDDIILRTSYRDLVVYTRKEEDLESIKYIPQIISKLCTYSKYIILPSTESINTFVLENRKYFKNFNFYIPLVDIELYKTISNKKSFYNLCNKNNLDVPQEIISVDETLFPLVFKPKCYDFNTSLKPILIYNFDEYKKLVNRPFEEEYWTIQKYVDGESFYLLFYFKTNGEWVFSSQKNLCQQPQGGSIIAAKIYKDVSLNKVAKKYAQMLIENRFHGLIMIELRKNTDKYFMIEANPRLWGPSQLFVDANIPIFENFLKDLGFKIKMEWNNSKNDKVHYFWNGGLKQSNNNEVYYGYSKQQLQIDYNYLISHEIYNREDTKNIFLEG